MMQHNWANPDTKGGLKKRATCSFAWQRQQIAIAKAKGLEGVNLTCYETLDEALRRIERQEKEYYD